MTVPQTPFQRQKRLLYGCALLSGAAALASFELEAPLTKSGGAGMGLFFLWLIPAIAGLVLAIEWGNYPPWMRSVIPILAVAAIGLKYFLDGLDLFGMHRAAQAFWDTLLAYHDVIVSGLMLTPSLLIAILTAAMGQT